MVHHEFLFSAGLFLLAAAGFSASEFPLFKDGKPAAELVMPENAGKTFQKAGTFFNEELFRCTGTKLPQNSGKAEKPGRITFKLHQRPLAERDAFSISFPDSKTMRIEGTELSVRWAFNHILEKHAGIRCFFPPVKGWYGPEINHYPRKKDISVPLRSFSDRPGVDLYRCASWANSISENWNRNMLMQSGHMMSVDVFPVWKYAPDQSWPKEILPVLNGRKFVPPKPKKLPLPKNPYQAKRTYDDLFQYCWSNPASVRIAVDNILEILKNNPDKKFINMDVNDGRLRNAEQAAELFRAVPEAVKALEQYLKHPMCRKFTSDQGLNLPASCFSAVGKVQDYVRNPAVSAELKKLSARKDLPLKLRGQIKIMLGEKPRNLIANGDLEEPGLPMVPLWSRTLTGKRDTAHASGGKYAYNRTDKRGFGSDSDLGSEFCEG